MNSNHFIILLNASTLSIKIKKYINNLKVEIVAPKVLTLKKICIAIIPTT